MVKDDFSSWPDIIRIVGCDDNLAANNPNDIMSGSHLSKCSMDWSWPILMFSVCSKTAKNLKGAFLHRWCSDIGSSTSRDDWQNLSVVNCQN